MSQNKPTITGHMMVKNEDQWIWFAIQSVLKYLDKLIIYDTGSTDKTKQIIKSIVDSKIIYKEYTVTDPKELIQLRQQQLDETDTDWLWMIDGDEIYPERTTEEIVALLKKLPHAFGIIAKRYDLLGDVWHYQSDERVGGYDLFGTTAHHSLRLVNTKIPGLTISGAYPNEGFMVEGKPIIDQPKDKFLFTTNRYWHTTYLKRSSLGSNLLNTLHRKKFKIEMGKKFRQGQLPEVFFADRSSMVPNPLCNRGVQYEIAAAILTPFKRIKRHLFHDKDKE